MNFLIAFIAAWSINACDDQKDRTRTSTELEEVPGYLESKEESAHSGEAVTVSIESATIRVPEGAIDIDYSVRLSTSETLPEPVSGENVTNLGNQISKAIVAVELFETETRSILSSSDLNENYELLMELEREPREGSKIGAVIVANPGQIDEKFVLATDVSITNGERATALIQISKLGVVLSRVTNAIVVMVEYILDDIDAITIVLSTDVTSEGGGIVVTQPEETGDIDDPVVPVTPIFPEWREPLLHGRHDYSFESSRFFSFIPGQNDNFGLYFWDKDSNEDGFKLFRNGAWSAFQQMPGTDTMDLLPFLHRKNGDLVYFKKLPFQLASYIEGEGHEYSADLGAYTRAYLAELGNGEAVAVWWEGSNIMYRTSTPGADGTERGTWSTSTSQINTGHPDMRILKLVAGENSAAILFTNDSPTHRLFVSVYESGGSFSNPIQLTPTTFDVGTVRALITPTPEDGFFVVWAKSEDAKLMQNTYTSASSSWTAASELVDGGTSVTDLTADSVGNIHVIYVNNNDQYRMGYRTPDNQWTLDQTFICEQTSAANMVSLRFLSTGKALVTYNHSSGNASECDASGQGFFSSLWSKEDGFTSRKLLTSDRPGDFVHYVFPSGRAAILWSVFDNAESAHSLYSIRYW